jgi:hypothetical protein
VRRVVPWLSVRLEGWASSTVVGRSSRGWWRSWTVAGGGCRQRVSRGRRKRRRRLDAKQSSGTSWGAASRPAVACAGALCSGSSAAADTARWRAAVGADGARWISATADRESAPMGKPRGENICVEGRWRALLRSPSSRR